MAALAIVVLGRHVAEAACRSTCSRTSTSRSSRSAPSTRARTSRTSRRRSPTPSRRSVSAVPGVHHVESRSRQGISAVQVWFNYDADLNAGQNDIIQRIQQISNSLPSGIKQPFIVRVRPLEHPGLPDHGLRRRLRRAAALRHRLQHDRAPDRADQRRRVRQRGRRQDPADRGQPEPRPPVREGHLGPGRRAVGQRLELPHAVGRHQDRHHRLQHLHQQPVPARQADGGHRRPQGRRRARPRPGPRLRVQTRPRRRRASSGSTASARCTCG